MATADNQQKTKELSGEQVETALARVVESPGFADAGRLGAFLSFLVTRSLAGDTASLKESVLGVSVFRRATDYDPRIDPIVRVEARRLRTRLAEYYEGAGKDDPVLIELPKGTYVPAYRRREPTAAPVERRRPEPWLWAAAGAVAILAVVFLVWRGATRSPAPAPVPSVAVMPFLNLSPDPGNEYFSDGLTEELIDELAKVQGLKVVARSSVFQFKGKPHDVRDLARRFDVGAVVEGSVCKSGDRVRISAQLINGVDGYQVWSQTWERQMRDIFAVQEEIGRAIVGALRVQLRVDRAVSANRRYTEQVEAYNLLLQARYRMNHDSPALYSTAVDLCERALRIDPRYAPAYALMAQAYATMAYYHVLAPAEGWTKARETAEKAIQIDDQLPEAHAALAFALGLHFWDWPNCEKEIRRALELNPASPDAHGVYAIAFLIPHGRLEEASAELKRALELEPNDFFVNFVAAYALVASRRYDEAIAQYRKASEIKPEFHDLWWDIGMASALGGRKDEARQAFLRASQIRGRMNWKPDPVEWALLGDLRQAKAQAVGLEGWAARTNPRPMEIVYTYAALGDRDRAFAWLEKSFAVRDEWLVWLKVDPRIDPLRSDPRLKPLLKRIGVEQ